MQNGNSLKKTALALTLLWIAGVTGCSQDPGEPEVAVDPADRVFLNGRVYTVNEASPWAEAVAVSGKRIVYVGDTAGAKAYVGEGTERHDLLGKMLLPGFVSAHDHLVASNWVSYGVSLYDATSKEEYLALIRDYVAANPDEKVIRGIGWQSGFYGGTPTAAELDAVVGDRPAIILDFTIHDAWLNTKALEVGGITKDTPDPVPGVTYWHRDDAGNPTGTAVEFAWMPTYVASGAWEPDVMVPASAEKNILAAASKGMTTFLNPALVTPNVNNTEGMFADYETILAMLAEWEAQGMLPLRAFIQPGAKSPSVDAAAFAERAQDFARRYNSDRLRSFGIKIHPEGNWSSRTSLQDEPYAGTEDNFGAASIRAPLIRELVLESNKRGLDVIIHVDGGATVRGMIDAIEASRAAGNSDERNALHHYFWPHPDDHARVLAMQIPVNVTPNFFTDWTGQDTQARELLGEKRIEERYARYPELAVNGNRVSISGDLPSSPLELIDPLFNIEAAITLQDPTNPDSNPFPPHRRPMTLPDAIEAVTIDAAWQLRMEEKLGTIEVGKYADLVVLEQNLFDVAPRDVADVNVLATMMDGAFTFGGDL